MSRNPSGVLYLEWTLVVALNPENLQTRCQSLSLLLVQQCFPRKKYLMTSGRARIRESS